MPLGAENETASQPVYSPSQIETWLKDFALWDRFSKLDADEQKSITPSFNFTLGLMGDTSDNRKKILGDIIHEYEMLPGHVPYGEKPKTKAAGA